MMLRRTPCIGTCSTTYGDLVCRGCKRFAHEIVQWNGFDPEQRRVVWQRLLALRAGAVRSLLQIFDEVRLRERAQRSGLAVGDDVDAENLLYELLQRLQWREPAASLDSLGASLTADADLPLPPVPESLLAVIDREFYRRSVAQYERNYRISAE
jgi:hypothetical protein